MTHAPNHVADCHCPRCGYDQSGLVATWTEACPLEGICSECGSAFAWHDAFHPPEFINPRHVEHCPRRKIVSAAWRTWTWTILPWKFWQRVGIRSEIKAWRLVAWLTLVLVSLHLINASIGIAARFAIRGTDIIAFGPGWVQEFRPFDWIVHSFVVPAGSNFFLGFAPVIGLRWNTWNWSPGATLALSISVVMPTLLLCCRAIVPQSNISPLVVARLAALGLSWMILPLFVRLVVEIEFLVVALSNWQEPWMTSYPIHDALQITWPYIAIVLPVWATVWWLCAMLAAWKIPERTLFAAALLIAAHMIGCVVLTHAAAPWGASARDLSEIPEMLLQPSEAPLYSRTDMLWN